MSETVYRENLISKRAEILAEQKEHSLSTTMDNNTRQGDMADQASGTNEVHIQLKLKQTDAKILQAIEEALVRLDEGSYGVCRDCGGNIAPARLNAIPWTRVCIECKEKQKSYLHDYETWSSRLVVIRAIDRNILHAQLLLYTRTLNAYGCLPL